MRTSAAAVLGLLAVSAQAVIASPCHERADLTSIYKWVEPDAATPCLEGRLAIAVEVALAELDPLARDRGLPCSAHCWLDRATSAIARVDHRESIWPRPPDIAPGDVVFIVCVPDLFEGWMWIAVSEPDPSGRVEVEVSHE